ncbi:MAG: hypothetical protein GX301_00555 [Gracilibacteraceae bacterium]|nr:hypothetical protein [Gracilibacteraceae bacterium]
MIKVEVLDRVFQYDSSEKGAEDIIQSVSDITSQSGLILDCMDIDGNRIYAEYDEYIRENIGSIKDIFVRFVTEDEFIKDIIQTTYSYIQGVLPEIQPIIDSLYTGQKDAGHIDNLGDLMEGIAWIFSVNLEIIAKYPGNKFLSSLLSLNYEENIQRLEEAFNELKAAIMNMDYILIADILNYEISDVFNSISTTVQKPGNMQ